MEIKFEIGAAVSAYRNRYELYVESMSGDGDGYNKETFLSNGVDDTEFFEQVKLAIVSFALSAFTDKLVMGEFEELEEVIDLLGIDWDAQDFYYETFGKDSTSQEIYACPEEMKLFYYDSAGTKYKVNFVINGDCYATIYRHNRLGRFWKGGE